MTDFDQTVLSSDKLPWKKPSFEAIATTTDIASANGLDDDEFYSLVQPS